MKDVILIFDIGKTNKKQLLFDTHFQLLSQSSKVFEEISDDDGFPMEDLVAIEEWILSSIDTVDSNPDLKLVGINFSTYGASLVCLDEKGKRCTPFYNYLKPLPADFRDQFFRNGMSKKGFESSTCSPFLGMLNSGLQLYFLKNYKPHYYDKIKSVLHFPQYLSYLVSKRMQNDYTSLGCHTGMWDFKQDSYADWFKNEGFSSFFPPIESAGFGNSKDVHIGCGIHDSTASCLPYLFGSDDPFVLISTGTWSIAMNPFEDSTIKDKEFERDMMVFMTPNGSPIKTARLHLGLHFEVTVKSMQLFFNVDEEAYKSIHYDSQFIDLRNEPTKMLFNHSILQPERFGYTNGSDESLSQFDSFEQAYHQFILELIDIQYASIRPLLKNECTTIFIDGGFTKNHVFTKVLAQKLPTHNLFKANNPIGSALGAYLMVNELEIDESIFREVYDIEKVIP